MLHEKKEYQAPLVELFEVQVERGFAGSSDPESSRDTYGLGNTEQMNNGETLQFN